MSKTTKIVIGWIVSIILAMIGAFWGGTQISNQQSQAVIVNVNGQTVSVDAQGFEETYDDLKRKYEQTEAERARLQEQLDAQGVNHDVSSGQTQEATSTSSVLLFDLDYIKANGTIKTESSATDLFGTEHANVIIGHEFWGDISWREYHIDGKYQKFKGTLFLSYEARDNNPNGKMEISGDGKTIKTISIRSNFKYEEIDLDISGVKTLRIALDTEDAFMTFAFLADAALYN